MMQQKIQQNRRNRNSRMGVRNPYVGSGKVRETPYGPVMRLSFNREDLVKLAESLNEQGWVSFDILSCRRPGRAGLTHYGRLDAADRIPQWL